MFRFQSASPAATVTMIKTAAPIARYVAVGIPFHGGMTTGLGVGATI